MKTLFTSNRCSKKLTLFQHMRQHLSVTLAVMALFLTLGAGSAMARPLGIDVSRFQGTINWTSVKGSGITFSWAQATRGNYLTNVNYVANMINGKAAGVIMGPYHYATPATNSALTEANYFWALAGQHILADGKTLMPMLDIEEFNGHVGATSYSDWATQWVNAVTAKAASNGVSIQVILYSSASFMCNFDTSLATLGNNIANYGTQDPQTGTPWDCCTSCNLWGGTSWDFWQYTSTGTIPGITGNVDHDVFNGTSITPWIATAAAAPVISNVSAGSLTDTSATITWDTDINSDSVVNYGLTTAYGTTSTGTALVVNHSRTLTGLSASTTYHYRVKSKNSAGQLATSGDFTFTTLAPGQVGDIVIDNIDATVVGTWSTASGSTDKFGTDYRYKSGGTGAAYVQFTPTISMAGDYDVYCWYPQGANRTVSAPYVISYNGGTATVNVNQQSGGGAWNLLGTFNFVAGTTGNIKLKDNFADSTQVVMADAVKFSFVPAATPPAAPSGLTATAVSSSQINLGWTDNSTDEDNFVVARSTVSGGPYSDIATLAANVTSYNNTGLSGNTAYHYVVRASNAGGSSALSAQASATTPLAAPAAPSGLTATAASSSQINLSWTDNSSTESGFIVARSTVSGGPYTDVLTLGANVTSASNTGLSASTTYYYVVRAYNATGSSANTAQASATTLAAVPTAPSGLTATAFSSSQINLAWTDNSSTEANFIVARSTTVGGPYTDLPALAANTTSYGDTGLATSTTYYYVVRASNASGSSANSAEASATTQAAPTPAVPSGLTATAVNSSQINLSWSDNSANENGFIVARSTTSGGPYSDVITVGANVTSASNTGLSASTTYYYVVRAYNGSGSSLNSAQASATTPAATTNFIIDNTAASVVGTWTTGTASTDKFGTDYLFKTGGTGSAYVQFTPSIATAGSYQVYEWHAVGANRTTNAPYVINYSGGSKTVKVNQEVAGGAWNLLGIYSFAAGTAGNVRVTDNFPDATQVAIADGVQFSYLTPANVVHVQSITMSWVASGTRFLSKAVVKVVDGNGNPVSGATVTGNFTGAISNPGMTAVTGSLGNATFTSTASIRTGTVTFTVTDVTGNYDATANVVTSASATK
jgi:GH25 family lysozyme M1 (1,4-beta-N-acetylmuramidase)